MLNDDIEYLNRRANEELEAAAKASNPIAAQVHREMSDRFRARVDEIQTTRPSVE